MNDNDQQYDATQTHLTNISEKIKEYRSIINEMWALPEKPSTKLDSAIHGELDRVTDATEKMISAYRTLSEKDYSKAKQIADEALSEVVKSTSAALETITEAVKNEADRALRLRTIRRGDFGTALDARGEARQHAKEARRLYEKDDEEAIQHYKGAIDEFSKAADLANRGGFGWGGVMFNVLPILLAIIAITPIGDWIKEWIKHLFVLIGSFNFHGK